MDGNYIKVYRSFLDWEWYGNTNTKVLFLHMLLKANWKDSKYEGTLVPRGSFVSSYSTLSEECSMTVNEVRTAIKHLILTGEITSKSHSKYTVFTVNNYGLFQDVNTQINNQITSKSQADHKQLTNKSQAINKQLTTSEEEKKERIKEGKNKRINNIPPLPPLEGDVDTPTPRKRFVPPSVDDVKAYCFERSNGVDPQKFVDYYTARDWYMGNTKMRDWKAAVRTWERQKLNIKPQSDKKSKLEYLLGSIEED